MFKKEKYCIVRKSVLLLAKIWCAFGAKGGLVLCGRRRIIVCGGDDQNPEGEQAHDTKVVPR